MDLAWTRPHAPVRVVMALAAACGTLSVISSSVAADDDPAAAGENQYRLRRFDEAIAEYRKAYELKADPVFLFNIAECYRELGRDERALFFYRRFLSTAPGAANRSEAEERVAELDPGAGPSSTGATPAAAAPTLPLAPRDRPAEATLLDDEHPGTKPAPPLWTRWWLWTALGAVVVVGVAAAVVVSSSGGGGVPRTDLGNARFF